LSCCSYSSRYNTPSKEVLADDLIEDFDDEESAIPMRKNVEKNKRTKLVKKPAQRLMDAPSLQPSQASEKSAQLTMSVSKSY
jgi:hypothetical protein